MQKFFTKCQSAFQKGKCAFQKALMLFDTFSKEDDVLISNMYLELKSVNVKGLMLKLKGIEYF